MKVTLIKDYAGQKKGHSFVCNKFVHDKLAKLNVIDPVESDKSAKVKNDKSVKVKTK